MDHETKAALHCLFWAVLTCTIVIAAMFVRPVGAEDDCAFFTLDVVRLPIVDQLVCVGEGWRE